MKLTLRQKVGQLIIAGLGGAELTAMERAWLKLIRPSGVILFRRNIEELKQVVALLREASNIIECPAFRCVDLEGGLVDRLRDLLAPMPSPAAVYATGKRPLYKKHGLLIAREARLLGFNAVFAPVLDLALPASASVMRTRSVSSDPEEVITYATNVLDGFRTEGVLSCGKHFPGLGGGALDSHQAMPIIERSWRDLWSADIAPFRRLRAKLPLVMVAHAAYPGTPGGDLPASVSRFWISGVLRQKLGYKGLIISDDMEMGGILSQRTIGQAAVEAIAAGTDLLEICKDPALVVLAYDALLSEAERSPRFRRRVEESARRIQRAKRNEGLQTRVTSPTPGLTDGLRAKVLAFADLIKNNEAAGLKS